jgi:hypothetical protein
MRKATYWLGLVLGLAAVLLGSPSTGTAQNRDARAGQRQTRDRFVISARAGGINAVTGKAQVHGKGTAEWQLLTIKEDLVAGDVVKTGLDSHVEMLLNPGSYLRVGENSEFELTDNSLENLEVRLLRGTAIVEATGAQDTELMITITTPDARMSIIKRGLYRLNVIPGDGTELIVRKGRVMLSDSHTKIKDGNKVVFSSSRVSVAKLQKAEKKATDDLDSWSRERAETVAKANRKIRSRDLTLAMASYNDYWFSGFSFRRPRTQGMWVYNGAYNCYTFIPFYGWGWDSPYGGSYSNGFYGCCGRRIYNGNTGGYGVGNTGVGGYGGGGGNGTGGYIGGGGNGGSRPSPPTPVSAPREIPAAAERKIDRLNDRMPNQ